MADFTDQNIQDTYQRVVQIDNGQLQNGTGSVILSATELTSIQAIGDSNPITATEWAELKNIGSADISATEWGYVATMQDVSHQSTPLFSKLSLNGTGGQNDPILSFTGATGSVSNPHIGYNRGGAMFFHEAGNPSDLAITFINQNGELAATIDTNGTYQSLLSPESVANVVTLSSAQTITGVKTIGTNKKLQFRDSGIYLNSNTDGTLQIVSDNKVNIFGNIVRIYANLTASGDISASGDIIGATAQFSEIKAIDDLDTKITFGSSTGRIDFESDNSIQLRLDPNKVNFTNINEFAVNAPITASGNISASGKIFSSGYYKNGVALFTNPSFTGNVTASGNISASGDMFANNITLKGNINANGNIIGDDNTSITNLSHIEADEYLADSDGATGMRLSTNLIRFSDTDDNEKIVFNPVAGHITASGNISASGNLTVNSEIRGNTGLNLYPTEGSNNGRIQLGQSDTIFFSPPRPSTDISTKLGTTTKRWSELNVQHITASGTISASGNITAPSYTGQLMALDRLNYYITINSNDYFLGRNVGVESGDFDIAPTSPFSINDEQVFAANILPVPMATIGLRTGIRVAGEGICQIWITTGSRSDWPTANTVPLGFGASGSLTMTDGQDFGTLDIPEFSVNDDCDVVYVFVRTPDTDNPTVRITGQLYGRTR